MTRHHITVKVFGFDQPLLDLDVSDVEYSAWAGAYVTKDDVWLARQDGQLRMRDAREVLDDSHPIGPKAPGYDVWEIEILIEGEWWSAGHFSYVEALEAFRDGISPEKRETVRRVRRFRLDGSVDAQRL